jgi:hypothetical protein
MQWMTKMQTLALMVKINPPSTSWGMFWPPTVLLHDGWCIYTCQIAKRWCASSIHKQQLVFQQWGCHNVIVESFGIIQWWRYCQVCWWIEVRWIMHNFCCHIVWTNQKSHCIKIINDLIFGYPLAYLGWVAFHAQIAQAKASLILLLSSTELSKQMLTGKMDANFSFKLGNITDYK